jgi:hypothetical protein
MHPLLARYLNLDAAADTLSREDQGQVLKSQEQTYASTAHKFPDERSALLAARGQSNPSPQTQAALVRLASHATVRALEDHADLGPLLASSRETLVKEGAEPEEADRFLAALVLEEAFGDDTSVDDFDAEALRETLEQVPALAALTQDRVAGLGDAFVRTAAPDWRRAHELAARALLEAAWMEGPEPINAEHVDAAQETLAEQLGKAEEARGAEALRRFLQFLKKAQLLGPRRLEKLERRIAAQPHRGPLPMA